MEKLTEDQRVEVMEIIGHSEMYAGPIPHPDHLQRYEAIVPGSADRLIKMAENQSAHRQCEEAKVNDAIIKSRTRGQYFGFILVLVALIGGFALILSGKVGIGTATIIGSAATLALAFIYGKVNNK